MANIYIDIESSTIVLEFDPIEEHYCQPLPDKFYYLSDESQQIYGIYTNYVSSEQTLLVNNLTSLYRNLREEMDDPDIMEDTEDAEYADDPDIMEETENEEYDDEEFGENESNS